MEFKHRNPKHDDDRHHELVSPDQIDFADGWNEELWLDFLEVWEVWHLNDMQAGCEHQRTLWDSKKKVEIVTYRMTSEVLSRQNKIESAMMESAKKTGKAELTDSEQEILSLPWEIKGPERRDLVASGNYEEKGRETKAVGWLYEKDHPEGILCKPCPECGYKYGSAWLEAELPDSVVSFIEGLPEADRTPYWC